MEEKIERTLRGHVKRGEGPWASINVERAATEIAKLWLEREDDLIQDLGMERIAHKICKNRCNELEAELADMQQRLIWAEEQIEGG